MGSTKKTNRCPTCKAQGERQPTFPFCSERCRLVDLSRWLDEGYRVPANMLGDE